MNESNGHSPGPILGYIHDGYTRQGYIEARKHLHPAVRFEYRPMLLQNRSVVFRQIERANDPRREETTAARAIAAQVVWWDLQDHKGETVPIALGYALNIEPNLSVRLFKIVTGTDITDEDPEWSRAEKEARDDKELQRTFAGKTLSDEEADEIKNSVAG